MRLRRAILSTACTIACLGALAASAARAEPFLHLDVHHNQTNFAPGDDGTSSQYWFDLRNVGDDNTTGTVTLTAALPSGLKRASAGGSFRLSNGWAKANGGVATIPWSCPGSPGDTIVTCTTPGPIPRHTLNDGLVIKVSVDPGVKEGSLKTLAARVSGGGAPEAPKAAGCSAGSAACATEPVTISSTEAPFGVPASSYTPDFLAADGQSTARRSGEHPHQLFIPFDFNSRLDGELVPNEHIRDLTLDLPPGFVGSPTAVAECPLALFTIGECPGDTQVGRIDVKVTGNIAPPIRIGLFNLFHPRNAVSDIAFAVIGNPVHTKVHLDPANRYAITSTTADINETLPALHQRVTLWGVPADHSHDSERCILFKFNTPLASEANGDTSEECALSDSPKPFLTAPSQCESPNVFRIHHYDSWQDTGDFGPEHAYTIPGLFTDCDKPRFEPEVEIEPTGKQANTPTGLDVHVKIAQNENPNALNTPPVKRFTVTLPEGMSFSPSFADGLKSCTLAQMKLGTNEPIECPDAARIGEVELSTPLLPRRAEGSMYLAAQGDNPFGSTFALLLVIEDTEERGALVKIPGRIDVDPVTGQIVTVFDENPQFPFDDLTLKFRSGPRAPLVSPPACGKHTIGVEVASYAQPKAPVDASNTYEITEGPNGTPCPPEPSKRPFHPTYTGGTLNPVAGSFSTFLFRMTRSDDEQELSRVTSILPPGLVAKIAGISSCPDQAIASISPALGTGASEAANPACPASSQIGTVSAGLGAGPGPNYFGGKVYLAGPYKGAALSLAVVAPALAGPFDLGNVVVRAALRVHPETSQVTAVSDPFPTILHGVILRVRDIRLRVDRPETTINPTNCSKMSVGGEITGVGGSLQSTADDSLFNTSAPFQVGSCGDLTFKPKLDFRLFGGTKRGAHPKFRATLTMPPGGANIKSASVALPKSEFLDQGHIKTICTRVQFAQEACPPGSVYGTVSARTPLLDETLTGNIYLRSSSNPLPDLVAAFRGGRIDANVVGRIDSVNGGIRNTFDFVPDVPVTEAVFTFAGGKKGLLVNSRDICAKAFRATARFTGQNGATKEWRPKMQAKCGKSGKAKKRKR
jgi:hypothetical protein